LESRHDLEKAITESACLGGLVTPLPPFSKLRREIAVWGCEYLPFYSGTWGTGGFFPNGVFLLLFYGLVIMVLVYIGIEIYKALTSRKSGAVRDKIDSLAILNSRFARGDINEEEYSRMKSTLDG
jgi:putative membrane protein